MGIYQSDLPPDFAYVSGGPWCKIKQIVNEKASDKMRTGSEDEECILGAKNVPRNIHSYLVFKIFQNVFSKAENIVFFITMLAYFEKYGMIKDKSSTLQCENVT